MKIPEISGERCMNKINILQDIIYGLENFPELEPNEDRIRITKEYLPEYYEIWNNGHGLLSSQERIDTFKELLRKISI
jgi:hypothetical protein